MPTAKVIILYVNLVVKYFFLENTGILCYTTNFTKKKGTSYDVP